MKKRCLIITATINPNSNFVSQANPKDRRIEYLEVLKYYHSVFSDDIYFVENSDYNISDDKDFQLLFKTENVFYINQTKSIEVNKGKGYQEFKMLDDVVAELVNKYDEFLKVSGRYLTTNFSQLISQKNNGIIIDRHQKKQVAITSFFRCTIDFYQKNIKGCYQKVNDDKRVFIEHILYQELKNTSKNKIDLFITTPYYKGVSGSYGGSLNRHPLKIKLINLERMILRITGGKELKKEFK